MWAVQVVMVHELSENAFELGPVDDRTRSRHSRRIVPTNCSAMAFARGARIGVRMTRILQLGRPDQGFAGFGFTVIKQESSGGGAIGEAVGAEKCHPLPVTVGVSASDPKGVGLARQDLLPSSQPIHALSEGIPQWKPELVAIEPRPP